MPETSAESRSPAHRPLHDSPTNPGSGRLVILLMFAAGLLAAIAAVGYRFQQTHGALQLWGPQGVRLIETAPRVELYAVEDSNSSASNERHLDLSQARGLLNLRYALTLDASYDFSRPVEELSGKRYQLVFADDAAGPAAERRLTVELRLGDQAGSIARQGEPPVLLSDETRKALTKYFHDLGGQ